MPKFEAKKEDFAKIWQKLGGGGGGGESIIIRKITVYRFLISLLVLEL